MKPLPPLQYGMLPVSYGDPVKGHYYSCCDGLAIVARPLRVMKTRRNGTIVKQYKSKPFNIVLVGNGMRIQHREQWYFTSVAKAIEFAEAALPLLVFFDIDPRSDEPPKVSSRVREQCLQRLGVLYQTIMGVGGGIQATCVHAAGTEADCVNLKG